MARPRKRHVQTEMRLKFDKNRQRRGGPRPKAGRKPTGPHAGVSHLRRPDVNPRHPKHITLRVSSAVGWLRRFDTFAAIRHALRAVSARHPNFRIVHISVQNTHVHLICEAESKRALERGLQGFQISAAKALNAAISKRRRTERHGRVFTDRYHREDLDTPRQVRNALAYVINNWRRHGVDRGALFSLHHGRLDPYASGLSFADGATHCRRNHRPCRTVTNRRRSASPRRGCCELVGQRHHRSGCSIRRVRGNPCTSTRNDRCRDPPSRTRTAVDPAAPVTGDRLVRAQFRRSQELEWRHRSMSGAEEPPFTGSTAPGTTTLDFFVRFRRKRGSTVRARAGTTGRS